MDFDKNIYRNPCGASLIMRHYSRIVPRDFDLSPNFEIIKYSIIGMNGFDYWSIRAQSRSHTGQG